MITHHLKILPRFFDAIASGLKTFEIRDNRDRDFHTGDHVSLEEIDRLQLKTGRKILAEITYLTDYEQKPGYVVFAIRVIEVQK